MEGTSSQRRNRTSRKRERTQHPFYTDLHLGFLSSFSPAFSATMQRNNEQIDEIEDDLRRALIPRPPSPTATQRERNNDDAFSVANEQRWYQNSSQIFLSF